MYEVTFTVKADSKEDLPPVLRQLLMGTSEGKGEPAKQSGETGQPWTADDFSKFWRWLTPDCKAMLALIAQKPDGYPVADIETKLGWKGLQIAGRMSSVGHQMNSFKGRPWPVQRDYTIGAYKMPDQLAAWIVRLEAGQPAA